MQEIDKIKFEDLFEGNPFDEANKKVSEFVSSVNSYQSNLKKIASDLLELLNKVSKTNVEEIEKLERLSIAASNLAKMNKQAESTKKSVIENSKKEQEVIKKTVELTLEQAVLQEKQKLEKSELLKKAKEIAKEELGLNKITEKNNGAYKKLNDRLTELRKIYKDLAAEASQLELDGDNSERLSELKQKMAELIPEISRIDENLKKIDADVGQFNRNVGDYSNSIVKAFDDINGKVKDNIKELTGLDSQFESLDQAFDAIKKDFEDFKNSLKDSSNGVEKLKNSFTGFFTFLKNAIKTSGLAILLLILTNITASAQKLGGTFNTVKENGAGLIAVLEGLAISLTKLTGALFNLFRGDFEGFKKNVKDAFSAPIPDIQALGAEVAKLKREIDVLSNDASNSYGNFASDIETQSQIISNSLESDDKRFSASLKKYEIERQELELRLAVLEKTRQLREKELELETKITMASVDTIRRLRESNLSYEERNALLLSLPNSVQQALITLQGVEGDIEVLNEDILRRQYEFNNFIIENTLKNASLVAKAGLDRLKNTISNEFNSIGDSIDFTDSISKTKILIDRLTQGVSNQLDIIFKSANINLSEFNGKQAIAITNVDDLISKLKSLGLGQEQIGIITDLWKDGVSEINNYNTQLLSLQESYRRAKEAAIDQSNALNRAFQEIVLNQRIVELSNQEGIIAFKNLQNLQKEYYELRIKNLKAEELEAIKSARSDEERRAIFDRYINQIQQLEFEFENLRLAQEREINARILGLQKEINEIIRARNELEFSEKLEKARQDIIFNLSKAKKLQQEIYSIQLERIKIEEEEAIKIAKTEEEKFKIIEKFEQKRRDLAIKNAKDIQNINRQFISEVINYSQRVISEVQNAIQEDFNLKSKSIENQINSLNSALDKERELALKGVSNNIDEISKRVAELDIQQRELAQKEQQAQLALAFINSVASYAKQNPQTAVQNAFKDIVLTKVLAKVIAGAFAEGVENFKGVGTETSDSNLVLISRGESIITASATKKYKGLPTAMNNDRVEEWINNYYNANINIDIDELGNIVEKRGRRKIHYIRPRL